MAEADPNVDYAETEYLYNRLMAPALEAALAALALRPGQRVLDAGCGPGGIVPLFWRGVAPDGSVLGLDYSLPHVERARALAQAQGLGDAVTIEQADLRVALPVAPHSCDVVWTADVLYPDTVGDCAAVVRRLSAALKPGGALAIFYGNWLRPLYLPGYARLEHLICVARETRYAHERTWQGRAHPERSLGWLRDAGLVGCDLRVLPVVYTQPLPEAVRRYLTTAIFAGHYADAVAECGTEVGMTTEDRTLWLRLSDPASPDFILDRADYYCVVSPLLALGHQPA